MRRAASGVTEGSKRSVRVSKGAEGERKERCKASDRVCVSGRDAQTEIGEGVKQGIRSAWASPLRQSPSGLEGWA